jgi:Na+-transporting NADH:ubiquinone oxidoreductase subunit A
VSSPALLRTRPGTNLHQIVQGRLTTHAATITSGSVLDGRVQPYLSRSHMQVFAAPRDAHRSEPGGVRQLVHRWIHAGIPVVIPNAVHDQVAPIGIPAIPLLRALSAGDADAAHRLGALELVEEDLALLSHVDGTGTDFGAMLRGVLDELEGAQ